MTLLYIDLFCGAGGTSTGVESAKLPEFIRTGISDPEGKVAKVIACVNHDQNAIASHAANHPDALHFTEDIRTLELGPLVEHVNKYRMLYPEALVVLWASLECTNFSKAKGGLPRDADSRTLADHLDRYVDALRPEYIQIENVEEFMSWGDLDEKGKPISKDQGRLYNNWVNHIKRLGGYEFRHKILNAADFGAYTSRKRFFGIFAGYGLPIVFPEPTHAKNPMKGLFGALLKWKPVKDCLDFTDEGGSIFGRKKPLVEASLDRILSGCIKFVAGGKESWLMKYNSINKETRRHVPPSVEDPCPTISCQGRLGLVQTKFLTKHYSGHPESKSISVLGPAHTITAKDHHSLVSAEFLSAYYGTGENNHSIEGPSPTLTTKDRVSFVKPKFLCSYNYNDQPKDLNSPCPTLLTKDRYSVVSPDFIMDKKQHFIDQQFGQSKPADIENPCGALTANPKYNLVCCHPWILDTNFGNVGSSIDSPAPVITASRKWHYLLNPQYNSKGGDINKPCFTLIARMDKQPPYLVEASSNPKNIPSFIKIVGDMVIYEIYESDSPKTKEIKEFMACYGILDIKMRMLRIPELKRIMGFPKNYVLIGTQAEQKKYIGNAVEVTMARKLCEALATELIKSRIIIKAS